MWPPRRRVFIQQFATVCLESDSASRMLFRRYVWQYEGAPACLMTKNIAFAHPIETSTRHHHCT